MIINGKWMSETEIIALISQLTADKKRLEKQVAKRGEIITLTVEEEIKFYKLTGNHFDGRCSECGSCVFNSDKFCAECGVDLRKGETE